MDLKQVDPKEVFARLGGYEADYPGFDSTPQFTANQVAYLVQPGVVLLARTRFDVNQLHGFLDGFPAELQFDSYIDDEDVGTGNEAGADLIKAAGQLCYMSFGPNRTKNNEAQKYINNILSSGHGCYDDDTDVLTAAGWKAWPSVIDTDLLATRRADGVIEYHRPERLVSYHHKGRMYRVDARGVDLLVTPDHKMLACLTTTREGRTKSAFELIPAETIGARSHAYTKSGLWTQPVQHDENDDVAALLGFAIGDGSYEGGNRVRFHLRRERKIAWLHDRIIRLSAGDSTFTLDVDADNDRYSVSFPARLQDMFAATYARNGERQIPPGVLTRWSARGLHALFGGLMQADGHAGSTGDTFDTTSPTLVGQFQQLCLHIGLAANVCYTYGPDERPTSYGDKPLTRLSVIRRELKPEVNKWSGSVGRSTWIDEWEGDVFCAEVPNNTLYVRRNGIPVWSGNSVLEHAQYTLLLYGAGRDFTHELVRHRTGVAFSQVSQRYVDGHVLRFVERPEYQDDEELHQMFLRRIDAVTDEYNNIARILTAKQMKGLDPMLSGEKKTELRKKVNQAARSCLPNETEAPIVFSGNIRALRHVCEMRAAGAADVPIREVTTRIFLAMQRIEPTLFADYKLYELPGGTHAVATDWRKV
jgi:flavin-dependent thymidylate synthase